MSWSTPPDGSRTPFLAPPLSPAYKALCLLICLDNYFCTSSTRSWAKDLRQIPAPKKVYGSSQSMYLISCDIFKISCHNSIPKR